jgi:hypothetical protein
MKEKLKLYVYFLPGNYNNQSFGAFFIIYKKPDKISLPRIGSIRTYVL